MFYVQRSADGSIETVSRHPHIGAQVIEESDPELQKFFRGNQPEETFSASDAEFVRVLEDLLEILISKHAILFTDLPAPAQKKLMARKGLRSQLQNSLDLLEHRTLPY